MSLIPLHKQEVDDVRTYRRIEVCVLTLLILAALLPETLQVHGKLIVPQADKQLEVRVMLLDIG